MGGGGGSQMLNSLQVSGPVAPVFLLQLYLSLQGLMSRTVRTLWCAPPHPHPRCTCAEAAAADESAESAPGSSITAFLLPEQESSSLHGGAVVAMNLFCLRLHSETFAADRISQTIDLMTGLTD